MVSVVCLAGEHAYRRILCLQLGVSVFTGVGPDWFQCLKSDLEFRRFRAYEEGCSVWGFRPIS